MSMARVDHLDRILDWRTALIESDRIKSAEYVEFRPMNESTLNSPGTINISIDSLDEFYWPRRGYLLLEGSMLKVTGNARYTPEIEVGFANLAPFHLFSNAKYELAGEEIESINNPGIASAMFAAAKYPKSFGAAGCAALAQCWATDIGAGDTAATNKGWVSRKTMCTKTRTRSATSPSL